MSILFGNLFLIILFILIYRYKRVLWLKEVLKLATSQKKSSSGTSNSSRKNPTRTNSKRTTTGKTTTKRNTKVKQQESMVEETQYHDEIILIVSLVVSLLLVLSNFNLSGKAGELINQLTFGTFGILAYVVPFILFIGVAFYISNRGNTIAKRKIISSIVLFIIVAALFQMITKKYIPTMNLLDYYKDSAVNKSGGGIIGGCIVSILCPLFDVWGTYIILIAVAIVLLMFITEKLFFAEFGKRGGNTIKNIRDKHREYLDAREEYLKQQEEEYDDEYEEDDYELEPAKRKAKTFTFKKEKPQADDIVTYEEPGEPAKQGKKKKSGRDKNSASVDGFDMGEFVPTDFDNLPIQRNGANEHAATGKPIFEEELEQKFKFGKDYDIKALAEQAMKDDSARERIIGFDDSIFSNMQSVQSNTSGNNLGDSSLVNHADSTNSSANLEISGSDSMNNQGLANDQNSPEMIRQSDSIKENITNNNIISNQPNVQSDPDMDSFTESGLTDTNNVDSAEFLQSQDSTFVENNGFIPEDVSYDSLSDSHKSSFASNNGTSDSSISSQNRGIQDTEGGLQNGNANSGVNTTQQNTKPDVKNVVNSVSTPSSAAAQGNPSGSSAEKDSGIQISSAPVMPKKEYKFPPLDLLGKPKVDAKGASDTELKETARKLQTTLDSFGVRVTITNVSCGPAVTRYELQPEQGVKVSKITNLADDIKLNLAAADIRIEAPIPGKAAVGIEVPNKENSAVMFRELIEGSEFSKHPSNIAFGVGKDIGGQIVVTDIAKMPHLLIAGATGSGKSVCINTLIMSILYKANPDDVKLIMVDPKIVELSVYNGIPHLLIPVVTEPKKASAALNWAVIEMTDRYNKFAELGVRDINGYNEKIKSVEQYKQDERYQKMPQIVIIVDELADLMMVAPGEVEDAICRLAQMARAAGLHLIIATQRPSVNVITGLIKANVPSRIAFSVSSAIDSRTILDGAGAEKLLGKGDMLFFPSGYAKPVRIQGAFVSDKEVSAVVNYLIEQNSQPEYSQDIANKIVSAQITETSSGGGSDRDAYFAEAGKFIIDKDKASIGMLQRVYKVGFNRAARIMDQLYDAGVVGPEEGTKPRKVLMSMEEFEQYIEEYV